MGDRFDKLSPALLLEASRALNAAGDPYRNIAVVVSDLAKDAIDAPGQADARLRAAILCDAAALRLSKRAPGGYEEALRLLEPVEVSQSEGKGARALILRALANGQKYKSRSAGAAPAAELQEIAAKIAEDLAKAFKLNETSFKSNRHFWASDAASPTTPIGRPDDPEDDLRLVFERERIVKEVIDAHLGDGSPRSDQATAAEPDPRPSPDAPAAPAGPPVTQGSAQKP